MNGTVTTMPQGALRDVQVWETSPLPPPLAEEARRLVDRLDERQRLWLSGFLAAAASPPAVARDLAPHAPPASASVTVLFGSQSGNAERVARQCAQALTARGIGCTVLDMIDCGKAELLAAQTLLVVVSTQGEGDPPDRAVPLWELLNGRKAPQLGHARFAVLALGDSSYEKFCETGRRFDARLEALGAKRIHPRVDCDVDLDVPANDWIEAVSGLLAESAAATSVQVLSHAAHPSASVANAFTRRNPFQAPVLVNQRLTVTGSSKDVRHIELSLEGSNIRYEPGDALGIVPRNDPRDVEALLSALPFDAEAPVSVEGRTMPLRDVLTERSDIGRVDRSVLRKYAEATANAALAAQAGQSAAEGIEEAGESGTGSAGIDNPFDSYSILDLVREHPPKGLDATTFAGLLKPLAPRLYSIASSLHASPDEAHLTVGVLEFEVRGEKRKGLVSGALAALTGENESVPVYLHRNTGFRLPAPDRPIIMIGPGTGVAPFRAFVAERAATGAKGRNWLFFGDRCFETDFLYQAEWLAWRKQGVLTRLDVAFSRDQPEKIYVQHRLRERGAEIWAWLQEGASIYVCGDASRMAPDVHTALREIAQHHGALDEEQATEYLVGLQRERRYQRDVY